MNRRARQLGLDEHALREPDRARRRRATTRRARDLVTLATVLRTQAVLPQIVDSPSVHAEDRRPPAHVRQPQHARAPATRGSTASRPATRSGAGYVLVGSAQPQRRPARLRRARHAERGRARRRHAARCSTGRSRASSASAPVIEGQRDGARAQIRYRARRRAQARGRRARVRRIVLRGAPRRGHVATSARPTSVDGPDPRAASSSARVEVTPGRRASIATVPLVAAARRAGGRASRRRTKDWSARAAGARCSARRRRWAVRCCWHAAAPRPRRAAAARARPSAA